MRILAIGDPHFKTTNIKESTEMVNAIYNLLEKEQDNLDFIIVMGDILDRHETIHVNPLTLAVKFLLTLATKKKTYVLIGNHDRPNNSDFLSDYHPFVGLNNIKREGSKSCGCFRRKLGIERLQKYAANYDFFENINQEENAYCLGLWCADGCNVNTNKTKRIKS